MLQSGELFDGVLDKEQRLTSSKVDVLVSTLIKVSENKFVRLKRQ